MSKYKVLVVEDEAAVREVIGRYLEARHYEVLEQGACAGAEQSWIAVRPDVAILDYSLPDGSALDLLPRLRAIDSSVPIIVLTGHSSLDLATEALKLGAEQFLTKPVELSVLLMVIQRSLENRQIRQKQAAEKTGQGKTWDPFVGTSAVIQRLAEAARRAMSCHGPVLIQGETGTEKGMLARWLHENGPRSAELFVEFHCSGRPADLVESELFGQERGVPPGAAWSKPGLLEIARNGTVFLDEAADLSLQAQRKLLKEIEGKKTCRLGDEQDREVDVALIAATHHDLPRLVWENRFHQELYLRIGAAILTLPLLRQRTEDIPALAAQTLGHLQVELGSGPVDLSAGALRVLQAYSWPGNIRELRNVLDRAVLLSGGYRLQEHDLHFGFTAGTGAMPAESVRTLEEMERQYIAQVLYLEGGRVETAAKKLGIPRSSLYHKIKQYGILRSGAGPANTESANNKERRPPMNQTPPDISEASTG